MKHCFMFLFVVLALSFSFLGCAGPSIDALPAEVDITDSPDSSTPVQATETSIIIASVDTSYKESAAVTQDGDLCIWGNGQTLPVKVMDHVQDVALGYDFYLVLKTDGSVWAWGENSFGQVGNGNAESSMLYEIEPVKIMDGVKQIDAGYGHALAVTETGDLYIWGDNSLGQIGDGKTLVGYGMVPQNIQNTPEKIMSDVAMAAAGGQNSAAVTKDGDLFCWGWNDYGCVGNGEFRIDSNGENICVITPFKVMSDVAFVSLGDVCSAAIGSDGSLYMWGDNEYGSLGKALSDNNIIPEPEKVMDGVKSVSVGLTTLAIDINGNLYAWGDNEFGGIGNGKIGDGDYTTADALVTVPELVMADVATVSSDVHTIAVTREGALYVWGNNTFGQLGTGEKGNGDYSANDSYETSPILIIIDPSVKAVTVAHETTKQYPTDKTDTTLNGTRNYGLAVTDGEFVYCANYTSIMKIDVQNQTYEEIALRYPAFMMVGIGYGSIYYTDGSQLIRINYDGSNPDTFSSTEQNAVGGNFVRVGDAIYCSEYYQTTDNLQEERFIVDMKTGDVNRDQENVVAQAADSGNIFWTDWHNIKKTPIGGGQEQVIASFPNGINRIALSDGWIYYSTGTENQLYRIKTDGSEQQKLEDITAECFNIAGSYIFFGNLADEGKLYRADVDGANSIKLRDDSGNMVEIDICMGRVFFDCQVFMDEEKTSYTNYYASILPDGSNLIEQTF